MNAETRVKKLVRLFNVPRNKTDRLAFRYLFSTLSAVEQIAVLASERGAGVENQLEDEIVHRDAFKELAVACGGYEGACDKTQELIDYLQTLEGGESIAALNVVAEGWLGCVFKAVAHLSPELFRSIGEDEARHNGYALSHEIPDSHKLEPIIRDLEYLMLEVAKSPNFVVPLVYLIGLKNVGLMGLNIKDSHQRACKHLNVSHDTHDYEVECRRSILGSINYPEEIETNLWQRNKQNIWIEPHEIIIEKEVVINTTNELKLLSKIVESVGKILSVEPRFRNVTRNKKIYRTKSMLVGIRTFYDEESLTTVHIDAKQPYKKLVNGILNKIKRIRTKKYETIAPIHHLKELLMPSQCPVVISYIGDYNTKWGYTKLSEIEGVPVTLFVGAHTDNKYPITIVMDHRIHDGKDILLFGQKLKEELEKG